MDEVDCVVVGAGVIGLAVARALALAGIEVLVLEQAYTIGFETSSRNSEVIHGGLYYPVGGLKARSCVEGRHRLYSYCREHGVPYARLGKLIVASSEAEIAGLEKIASTARGNGVDDLQWLDPKQARQLEPALNCVAALLSPSTGIIDSHALMLAYQGEAEAAGAIVVLRTPVLSGRVRHDGFELAIGGDEPTRIHCRSLVNAAGLHAPALARMIEGIPPQTIPPAYFCRGVYFTLSGPAPFHRLIYPVPVAGGSGCTSRWIWQGRRGSGPMWNGSLRSITRSTRHAARCSMPQSAITGRICRIARCSRAMPASGRRSAGRPSRPQISSCKAPMPTGCRGW
jgi:L-2-hydroxyglutarate oxidase LhgO